jgi:hypothetical protein
MSQPPALLTPNFSHISANFKRPYMASNKHQGLGSSSLVANYDNSVFMAQS